MNKGNKAELRILSRSENIGLARLTAAGFASQLDFSLTQLEEIKMAISEAVTNSIVHGYGEEEGEIKIVMAIENECLTIDVTDSGSGISTEEGDREEKMGTDGLGLIFIRNFMDRVTIESKAGQGTTIRMVVCVGKEGTSSTGVAPHD